MLRALADAGLRVPDDVQVVGFDADARNKYGLITLTAVQQDVSEIARCSIALGHERPASGATPARVPVRLAPGESCGCAAQAGAR